MAISIDELDILVRSFYEGRGEQVCALAPRYSLFSAWPRAPAMHTTQRAEIKEADPSPSSL